MSVNNLAYIDEYQKQFFAFSIFLPYSYGECTCDLSTFSTRKSNYRLIP